jgi:hypothetical protein
MIIKARSRKDGAQLARYLLKETKQQQAFLIDHRGSAADDLKTMLKSWEQQGYAITKAEKPLYHMSVRLADAETLSRDQWMSTLDAVEKELKLSDQPRAIVGHKLNGSLHLHIVYSRVDSERGIVINMGHDRRAHHKVARAKEREYGLREVNSSRRNDRNGNEHTRSIEHRMSKQAGTTRDAVCSVVQAAWESSKNQNEFSKFLGRFGMTLKPGERRDFVVEYQGQKFSPVRLLRNVKAVEFRLKMEVDRERTHEAENTAPMPTMRLRADTMTSAAFAKAVIGDHEEARNMPHSRRAAHMAARKFKEAMGANKSNGSKKDEKQQLEIQSTHEQSRDESNDLGL